MINQNMKTLNGEIRIRTDKELRKKEFTPADFYDIADDLGRKRSNISVTLRMFVNYGLLKVVKSTPNKTGGEPVKTYRVVNGASFVVKDSTMIAKEYKEKALAREHEMRKCANRLQRVMDGWRV